MITSNSNHPAYSEFAQVLRKRKKASARSHQRYMLPGTPLCFIRRHLKSLKTQERNGYCFMSDRLKSITSLPTQHFHIELSFHCLLNHATNKKLLQMFATCVLKNEYLFSTLCHTGIFVRSRSIRLCTYHVIFMPLHRTQGVIHWVFLLLK